MRRIVILLLAQIGAGKVGQEIDKAALCLGDQGVAVSKEQNILHPAVLQQHITQSNDRSGLTGTGGHDQQRLASIFLVKGIANGFDCTLLVIAARNVLLHHHILEGYPHSAQVEHLL